VTTWKNCCFLFTLFFGVISHATFSQDRCGTVQYTNMLQQKNTLPESDEQFEHWLKTKIESRKTSSTLRAQSTYTIPVVVHIIHNGEPLGSGTNVSAAQVLSQISVLNKDFNRLNADASSTPAEFLSVAGSIAIDFVLATQDPEGLPTSGIVRVDGNQNAWTMNDNYKLKALSYWPSDRYLNIWVCNLTDFLGYAQFPESTLGGLENASKNKLTDGVVISTEAFGSIDDGAFALDPQYNKGRTATHEIGHYLGLRHTWGDDNNSCSGTDYVADTPNQAGSTSGCPAHPRKTCEVTAMFQNYLDYTNDACMNIFTVGQVARMTSVLENSTRRKSLLTSVGSQPPVQYANDLGIKTILDPASGECPSLSITPTVDVRNYGTNAINSFRIRVLNDGANVEEKTFTQTLNLLESATVTFNALSYTSGTHNITFEIIQINGGADDNNLNNTVNQPIAVPFTTTTPFSENFNFALPGTWSILNPDQVLGWELVTAPSTSVSNKALKMDFFNYKDNLGEIDMVVTPVFDLSSVPVALLKFEVAHARAQSSNDQLKVIVLTGCNADINQGTVVYDKAGAALATAPATSSSFTPGSSSQWRKEAVDLSAFIGQSKVQLAFVGINDWGNNLYLDNISLLTSPVPDIALSSIIKPSPVLCAEVVSPKLRIINNGTIINSFAVQTTVGSTVTTTNFSGLNFTTGEMEVELTAINLPVGNSQVTYSLINPNGGADVFPADNTKQVTVVRNSPTDAVPLQENFEGTFTDRWTIANPTAPISWQPVTLNNTKAIYFNAFTSIVSGDESWLVSPVLDFSELDEASVLFDLSYGYRALTNDNLRIMASTNCGETFTTFLSYTGAALQTATSDVAWVPTTASHWDIRKSVDLSSLAGSSAVRVAFVFTNANGNNIYLDNIAVMPSVVTTIDFPAETLPHNLFVLYPNPASRNGAVNLTFNLQSREDVTVTFTDTVGKEVYSSVFTDALNQTVVLPLEDFNTGVYIARLYTKDKTAMQKIIVIK